MCNIYGDGPCISPDKGNDKDGLIYVFFFTLPVFFNNFYHLIIFNNFALMFKNQLKMYKGKKCCVDNSSQAKSVVCSLKTGLLIVLNTVLNATYH